MASKGDFHCHSTASDGRLTPTQVVDLAAANGVRVFALTDHDSTEGIAEARTAAAKHAGFTLVPGVELSTDIEGDEVHVLGYLPDITNQDLQAELERFRAGRYERGREMTRRLTELGMPISWERVLAHPTYIKDVEPVLKDLVAAGLAGMEVFYRDYDEETVARLAGLAKKFGLMPLGGSDYHALNNPGERAPGDIPLPDWAIRDF